MLRHVVATLACRGARRCGRRAFGDLHIGAGTRIRTDSLPSATCSHGSSLAQGAEGWPDTVVGDWEQELVRFHDGLRRLDDFLASPGPLAAPPERLFQGPLAHALTTWGSWAC